MIMVATQEQLAGTTVAEGQPPKPNYNDYVDALFAEGSSFIKQIAERLGEEFANSDFPQTYLRGTDLNLVHEMHPGMWNAFKVRASGVDVINLKNRDPYEWNVTGIKASLLRGEDILGILVGDPLAFQKVCLYFYGIEHIGRSPVEGSQPASDHIVFPAA